MLQHFLSFDKLIGAKLIKVLYYLGLIGIVLAGIAGIFGALASMGHSFVAGLGATIGAIIGTALAIVFWRFICELYMLFFRMSDDLRDMKNHQLGLEANTADIDIDL